MTREEYLASVKRFLDLTAADDAFSRAIESFCFGSYAPAVNGGWKDLAVSLLEAASGDRDGMLSYWLWELDSGRKWKPDSVTDKEGNPIPLQTVEDLADHLFRDV